MAEPVSLMTASWQRANPIHKIEGVCPRDSSCPCDSLCPCDSMRRRKRKHVAEACVGVCALVAVFGLTAVSYMIARVVF